MRSKNTEYLDMTNGEAAIWGIHAGKTGDADTLFLKKKYFAIGWSKMGNLGNLKSDREIFKAKVAEVYPDKKPGATPNNAGQLFRFVHEMKLGDLVVFPSKRYAAKGSPLSSALGAGGIRPLTKCSTSLEHLMLHEARLCDNNDCYSLLLRRK